MRNPAVHKALAGFLVESGLENNLTTIGLEPL